MKENIKQFLGEQIGHLLSDNEVGGLTDYLCSKKYLRNDSMDDLGRKIAEYLVHDNKVGIVEEIFSSLDKVCDTIFNIAINYNSQCLFDKALEKGYDINAVGINGNTPLILASSLNDENFVSQILKINSVDLNTINARGYTAAHYAEMPRIYHILDLAGADMEIKDEYNETAKERLDRLSEGNFSRELNKLSDNNNNMVETLIESLEICFVDEEEVDNSGDSQGNENNDL